MKLHDVRGVIFDKDGTMIEFQPFWIPVTCRVLSRLRELYRADAIEYQDCLSALGVSEGGEVDPEGQLAIGTYETISRAVSEVYARGGIEVDGASFLADMTRAFEEEAARQPCTLTADVHGLLAFLKKKRIRVAIATTDNTEVTQGFLRENGIEADIVSTCDGLIPKKPDAELIGYCARAWDTTCEHVLMVGDTPNDLRFARNAGARTVGVLTGVSSERALAPYADLVLANIGELKEVL